MADGGTRVAGAKPRSGTYWPFVIVALLVGGAGANIGLMVVATRDASFAVEPDYYRKALHWDEMMAQEARNQALGWTAAVAFERLARPGEVEVTARVNDRGGRPVEGARVAIETFHSARASHVLTATLAPGAAGQYSAALLLDRPGLWEVRLRVERGDETFTAILRQDLPRTP
jgi:nitrogen fixation protein FixH